jgi:hypothetical protein
MKTSSDEEGGAHQNRANPPDHCKGTVDGEIIPLYLVLIQYDQYPENREAEKQAD